MWVVFFVTFCPAKLIWNRSFFRQYHLFFSMAGCLSIHPKGAAIYAQGTGTEYGSETGAKAWKAGTDCPRVERVSLVVSEAERERKDGWEHYRETVRLLWRHQSGSPVSHLPRIPVLYPVEGNLSTPQCSDLSPYTSSRLNPWQKCHGNTMFKKIIQKLHKDNNVILLFKMCTCLNAMVMNIVIIQNFGIYQSTIMLSQYFLRGILIQ